MGQKSFPKKWLIDSQGRFVALRTLLLFFIPRTYTRLVIIFSAHTVALL